MPYFHTEQAASDHLRALGFILRPNGTFARGLDLARVRCLATKSGPNLYQPLIM